MTYCGQFSAFWSPFYKSSLIKRIVQFRSSQVLCRIVGVNCGPVSICYGVIMAIRPSKLIWLLCCTLTVLFTSLSGALASSSCLPSAAAVKSAYPGTHPHWRFRAHDRDGAKCWHPGTYAAASRHEFRTAHHSVPVARPRPVTASIDRSLDWPPPTALGQTSGAGWSAPVPVTAVDAAALPMQSSFAERFSPVFEVVFFERPTLVRRIEGLISNMQ
jgi:hypothetical protein